MRVLIAGSRDFNAGYRIDRALVRVSKNHENDMVLVTVDTPTGRRRNGADSMAREIADEFGWELERVPSVSAARADVCLAFLHHGDPHDDHAQIVAMKAEKAGISVWRYYEGGPRAPHDSPLAVPVFDPSWVDIDPEPTEGLF